MSTTGKMAEANAVSGLKSEAPPPSYTEAAPTGIYPPPQVGGYPPRAGGYPTQSGGYPPQAGGYPSKAGDHPPRAGGYPPQAGGYPPQAGGYPPQVGGYPPQAGGYPQQAGGHFPPSAGGYTNHAGPGVQYSQSGQQVVVVKSDSLAHDVDRMLVGGAYVKREMVNDWEQKLCGCCSNCKMCLMSCFCPCYVIGKNAEAMGKSCMLYGLGSIIPIVRLLAQVFLRIELRERRGIAGSELGDCCTSYWCGVCGLVQEHNEIVRMQEEQAAMAQAAQTIDRQ